jgi:uncharacterized membrane protein YgdD (TMEM256/DUF423 family)
MKNLALFLGSIFAATSVAIGAFGAHAWKPYLININRLETFETAAQYQMYGGLALILLGILHIIRPSKILKIASYFHITGSIIFPGSLYLICISQQLFWGAIAPIGGLAFILGFALMAFDGIKKD